MDKTSTADVNPHPKFYKHLTNPMPYQDLNVKSPLFLIQESQNDPNQDDEVDLNIDESFYKKVEWQKQKVLETIKPSETQQNLASALTASSIYSSISEEFKKEPPVKAFSNKDFKESLNKLDLIMKNRKPQAKKTMETSFFKKEQLSDQSEKEEMKVNKNITISKTNETSDSMQIINPLKEKEDEEDLYKGSKESNKMIEIMKEAHNQLFDPNFLSQIDPSTYTNPLFLIG